MVNVFGAAEQPHRCAIGAVGGRHAEPVSVDRGEIAEPEVLTAALANRGRGRAGEAGGTAVRPRSRAHELRIVLLVPDPDGNAWLVQDITTRLPGRV